MNRRQALKNTIVLGGAISVIAPMGLLCEGCNPTSGQREVLSNEERESIITSIADIIIPATDSPGAKDVEAGRFIVMMIRDCYPEDIQAMFINGVEAVNTLARDTYSNSFMKIRGEERLALVTALANDTDEEKRKFFGLIKELTFLGYFTSEAGATQALEYIHVPGKYEGCINLSNGQKAWAT